MGEIIQLSAADGHQLDAYLAQPAGAPMGSLVVVQEIFGVNSHIRSVCDRYAAAGYRALAPAMFDRLEKGVEFGYQPDDITQGRALKDKCDWPEAAADVEAARVHLAAGGKVGIVGYCWGGSLAFLGACEGGFSAAVGYYGGQIIPLIDRKPVCPVLLHFGDQDAGIPLSDVEQIRAAHPGATIHIYEGAGHGFNCDRRGSFDQAAADLALERTLAFFAEHLG